jgi:hypothetical protein
MRRRAPAFVLAVSAVLLALSPARALEETRRPAARAADAPGFSIAPSALGLRLGTPRFGLRIEIEPPQSAPLERMDGFRHEPLRGDLLFSGAPSAAPRSPGLGLGIKEGWQAFGAVGPFRWAKQLDDDSDMTLRFDGRERGLRPPGRQLNFGFQYRF